MFGNPHSANPSSSMTSERVEEVTSLRAAAACVPRLPSFFIRPCAALDIHLVSPGHSGEVKIAIASFATAEHIMISPG